MGTYHPAKNLTLCKRLSSNHASVAGEHEICVRALRLQGSLATRYYLIRRRRH